MALVVEVAALLDAPAPPNEDHLASLLEQLLTRCDRAKVVNAHTKYNEMHTVGLGLCALLHEVPLPYYEGFSVAAALGAHAAQVVTCDEALPLMS